jgi:hypothetical protein
LNLRDVQRLIAGLVVRRHKNLSGWADMNSMQRTWQIFRSIWMS